MTSIQLLTSIALAAGIGSAAALAQASPTQVRDAQDTCRNDAQSARADRHDDERRDSDKRCDERQQQSHDDRAHWTKPVLLPVANSSLPDQEAYGWQYFSAARKAHAVVISPTGEYFLSLGDGPRQITGPAAQVRTTQPVDD